MIHRSSITVDKRIFHKEPLEAYGLLGYVDGREGGQCDPPKDTVRHKAYMAEYTIGLRHRADGK